MLKTSSLKNRRLTMRMVLYKYLRIELNGSEKLCKNDNASSISNNKALPKYSSVACAKETNMTKSQPSKPKVILLNIIFCNLKLSFYD